ncbi:hypothetical protein NIES970_19620 [[Synechococcus] sp. NIES-970]|uniref:hypothetical protein n=1 Tax=Picosynechococcus sp. NKBG15041c TaxID=1407650 RepID=UPI000425379D|nr:hypothetical protein [Picosynechococcus sp. NKBG15041c]BAW97018.1 hypothetical protein NIES970_19620 [[Synechococcus] sp. NIES-970]
MRQVYLLLPITALSLSLGSCSLLPGGGGGDTPSPDTSQVVTPTPDTAPSEELFTSPTVGEFASVFIPSTDPDARRRTTTEGRPDPFADLPLVPQVILEPPPAPAPPAAQPDTPGGNGAPGTTANGTLPAPGAPSSGSTAMVPPPAPIDFTPILPTLPEPTAAQNTAVTGVVQMNGTDYVMVKSEDEPFSRYVRVGDYVANGQVLVKEIIFNRGNPVVVLEQYGMRVEKKVNETSLALS